MHRLLMIYFALMGLTWTNGCRQAESDPLVRETPSVNAPASGEQTNDLETPAANGNSTTAKSDAPREIVKEYWDAIFFDGAKVGYVHTVYENVSEAEQRLVKITADSQLKIQRFGEATTQILNYSSVESPEGALIRFESAMRSGEGADAMVALEAKGEVRNDQLELQLTTLGKTQKATRPWDPQSGGFFALEQTLERMPLAPGQQRTLKTLTPVLNQVADVEMKAEDWESVELLDGSQNLLRVSCTMKLGQNPIDQVLWINRDGQVLKTSMPSLKQITYRTSKERALSASAVAYDLGQTTIVPVAPALERPHQTKQITYQVEFGEGSAKDAFAETASQRVKLINDKHAEVTVRALRPGDPLGGDFPTDSPPTDADRRANTLIQSDDPEVVRLAEAFSAGRSDPWEVATALEKKTNEIVQDKNFSQALASAAEVARSKEGDCTEHAVLLAALCRARQIPARVAIGLVYHRPSGGFAYHMWTLVWIRDRWVGLDATLGQGGIGGGHLMVSQSDLDGVEPLGSFLPVLRLIGNLTVRVESKKE